LKRYFAREWRKNVNQKKEGEEEKPALSEFVRGRFCH